MDCDGDAEADVERIKQRDKDERFVFGIERDDAGGHGKCHGGVR
jgi:hypothetical protein